MVWKDLVALVAAILIALLTYGHFRKVDLVLGRSASARLEQYAVADRRGLTDRIGDSITDDLQAFQRQLGIDLVDVLAVLGEERGQASCGDDALEPLHFGLDARQQAVDQSQVS